VKNSDEKKGPIEHATLKPEGYRKASCLCVLGVPFGPHYWRRHGSRMVLRKRRLKSPDMEAAIAACILQQAWEPIKLFANRRPHRRPRKSRKKASPI